MDKLTALSVSIGVLAGVATFLAVGPFSGLFFIWAATIAWAAYFALGATPDAFKNTINCGIFGVFMAWISAIMITKIEPSAFPGFSLSAALIVTAVVIVMCLAARFPRFSAIPASVFGYSSTFAYLLQTSGKMTPDVLLGFSWDNPLLIISASFVIGTYFGKWSAQLSAKLTSE